MGFNFGNPLIFLVDTLFCLYVWILLLRFILQAVRADFYNPLSQFVWQVTNRPMGLAQRVIPRWRNYDLAALVLALLLIAIDITILTALMRVAITPLALIVWSLMKLVWLTLNLYFFSILVQAVASWVNPGRPAPIMAALWSINEPLLKPVRGLIPPIGGFDLSSLFVLIALQMALRLLPPLPGVL